MTNFGRARITIINKTNNEGDASITQDRLTDWSGYSTLPKKSAAVWGRSKGSSYTIDLKVGDNHQIWNVVNSEDMSFVIVEENGTITFKGFSSTERI